ncbi:hypothetical protein GCM10028814_12960 [Angustibacter aerolatus]
MRDPALGRQHGDADDEHRGGAPQGAGAEGGECSEHVESAFDVICTGEGTPGRRIRPGGVVDRIGSPWSDLSSRPRRTDSWWATRVLARRTTARAPRVQGRGRPVGSAA